MSEVALIYNKSQERRFRNQKGGAQIYRRVSNTKGSKQCRKQFALCTITTDMCTNQSMICAWIKGKYTLSLRNTSSRVVKDAQRKIRTIFAEYKYQSFAGSTEEDPCHCRKIQVEEKCTKHREPQHHCGIQVVALLSRTACNEYRGWSW